jgi:hypothetical protein
MAARGERAAAGDAGDRVPLSTPMLRRSGSAQGADPLSSWNNGAAKQTIIAFVQATTDASSPKFVPQEARVATFDQDGPQISSPEYLPVRKRLPSFDRTHR